MATIAEEQAANARARAEGYESAAHKEAAANFRRAQADPNAPDAAEYERQANIRAAQVTDPRTGAPFASASDMEAYANTQSQKVFNPATGAYFTSAADYEIDANRRAREAGYLNAADYESGLRTRVDPTKFPFIDPRTLPAPIIPEQFRSKEYAEERGLEGHANILKYNPDQPTLPGYDPNWRDNYPGGFDFHGNPITGGWIIDGGGILDGPPNPTVPSFGYPGYQDWSRFMPTNFQLAEGGGFHYQPWLTGGAGMGGGAGGFAGPDTWATGGGGTTGVPGVTYTPTNIWGDTTTGGNVTTDTSGKQWVMSPGGQWYPADSDYGEGLLGTGRLFDSTFYDSSGTYVGSEGIDRRSTMASPTKGAGGAYDMVYVDDGSPVPPSHFGTAWQDNPITKGLINSIGWNINPADPYGYVPDPISRPANPTDLATQFNTPQSVMNAQPSGLLAEPAASVAPEIAAEIEAMMGDTSSGPNTGPPGSGY